jgi:hypothetical protein
VELAGDLPFEFPPGPAALGGFGLVEVPGAAIFDAHKGAVMGPAEGGVEAWNLRGRHLLLG